jgi:hypothetical protein
VLLRQHGLEDEFIKIRTGGRDNEVEKEGEKTQTQTQPLNNDDDEWCEKVKKLLMDAGKERELLDRAVELWRTGKVKGHVRRGAIGVEMLLEMGDVAGCNWLQMNPDMVEGSQNDRLTVHTYSSLAHLRNSVSHYLLRCSLVRRVYKKHTTKNR